MNRARLKLLLALMVAMAAARLWMSASQPAAQVVQAVARPAASRVMIDPVPAPPTPPSPLSVAAGAGSDDEPAGNPFAVRHPPQPPAPPVAVAPVTPPVAEAAPDPAPPYQVIGTYDDQSAPGVFIATSHGVEIARVGTVLDAEYKVTAMTHQILTLQQLSSKREFTLSVPAGGAP